MLSEPDSLEMGKKIWLENRKFFDPVVLFVHEIVAYVMVPVIEYGGTEVKEDFVIVSSKYLAPLEHQTHIDRSSSFLGSRR
ncbi:hypothetical protein IFR05_004332 [Cadophora sp. M221]|nr:hypothetical protein IFR05_004332 [Cadophora sp. M221]